MSLSCAACCNWDGAQNYKVQKIWTLEFKKFQIRKIVLAPAYEPTSSGYIAYWQTGIFGYQPSNYCVTHWIWMKVFFFLNLDD